MTPPGQPIPAEAALIVLPGSKATLADLAAIREQGWDIDIRAHHRRGGTILGLCGGYQMLGTRVADPLGLEGPPGEATGLGLLDVATTLTREKVLRPVSGEALGAPFRGYEMHMGETSGGGLSCPFATFADGRRDGAISPDGRVLGTYVHGLLADARQRAALLDRLGAAASGTDYEAAVDAALDEIAAALEEHLDIDALIGLAVSIA
jgi:adenosylcobyric acid synthase